MLGYGCVSPRIISKSLQSGSTLVVTVMGELRVGGERFLAGDPEAVLSYYFETTPH